MLAIGVFFWKPAPPVKTISAANVDKELFRSVYKSLDSALDSPALATELKAVSPLLKTDDEKELFRLFTTIADAHQPCHAGSLYVAELFPDGDRGANSIPTKQRGNLHALWDSLLGPKFDAGDIQRRAIEIRADSVTWAAAEQATVAKDGLNPQAWLEESQQFGRSHVYTEKVLSVVEVARQAKQKLEKLDLHQNYLKAAGQAARKRAAFAAFRLAAILRGGL